MTQYRQILIQHLPEQYGDAFKFYEFLRSLMETNFIWTHTRQESGTYAKRPLCHVTAWCDVDLQYAFADCGARRGLHVLNQSVFSLPMNIPLNRTISLPATSAVVAVCDDVKSETCIWKPIFI